MPALLSAEITARGGRDPGELYARPDAANSATMFTDRVEAPANAAQKTDAVETLARRRSRPAELAGEKITGVLDNAPGNDAPIGGIKVIAASGWFAARPSGTEDIYKIYAESFRNEEELQSILAEAQTIVDHALGV